MKLVVDEAETPALHAYLRLEPVELVSSALALVEVQRAARIADPLGGAQRSRGVLDRIHLLEVDRNLLEVAATYASVDVRSLDAVHLASALRVGARAMLVYDRRLADAARLKGLGVLSPGT